MRTIRGRGGSHNAAANGNRGRSLGLMRHRLVSDHRRGGFRVAIGRRELDLGVRNTISNRRGLDGNLSRDLRQNLRSCLNRIIGDNLSMRPPLGNNRCQLCLSLFVASVFLLHFPNDTLYLLILRLLGLVLLPISITIIAIATPSGLGIPLPTRHIPINLLIGLVATF